MLKIAIGTAQFGLKYGINNNKGIPSDQEIISILDFAQSNGIDTLDCASAYGNAESKIGELAGQEFKIMSKLSYKTNIKELEIQLDKSLNDLRRNSIYGYLVHNADDLINYPKLWDELLVQKSKGKVNKIGYSLYNIQQLESLIELDMLPDIVQLPYSLLDRKFENYFENLKSLGAEIHTRSVFLQGLYFMELNNLPGKLNLLRNELNELKLICNEKKIFIGALAINFVYDNPCIDKVIIGVDSLNQLTNNLNYLIESDLQDETINYIKKIETQYPEMLNPVNW